MTKTRFPTPSSQNKFEKCALCHEAPLVAALKRFGVVSWRWLLFLLDQFMKIVVVAEFPARRSVSASTLPLIKTSGQSSTAMISSRMAATSSFQNDNDAITHFSHFEKNVDNVTTLEMDIRNLKSEMIDVVDAY
ncbi:putative group XIIA secretory phospholipase A2 [Trichinella spiralis]|uniref:putative group XIIA secretory phospholipase A2 n=1 Tax=Trichinella spiralis TaxID=6334 RepID=UPI0001EFC90E|nr:putative group XIIA secretory phospholipase A2 [Trichinella spiralis]